MLAQHIASGAGVTVASVKVPTSQCSEFGVIECDGDRITAFHEKPARASGLPDDPERCRVSMGNYVFTAPFLVDTLVEDAEKQTSRHDIGGDIIPHLVERGEAAVYDFEHNVVPGAPSWITATGATSGRWTPTTTRIRTSSRWSRCSTSTTWSGRSTPSTDRCSGQVRLRRGEPARHSGGLDREPGVIVSGGTVRRSVLSPGVRVGWGATVEDSVLLSGVEVGEGALVRRAIIDKEVVVPPGAVIGEDPKIEARRFTVSANGIVVVAKRQVIEPVD